VSVKGDELAAYSSFDAFARARMRELLRFAHVLTGDPHRAADLVQDALERTLMSWDRVVRKDDPEAYVRRAIVNRSVSVWRRTRRERLVADSPDRPYVDRPGHDDELWAALATLPPRQRAVLVLRYYEDLSEADTAAALGCSVGTVKSQAFKGLARLRTIVGTDGSDNVDSGLDGASRDSMRSRDTNPEGTRSWTS
jgi:RNA polymerase sigma-70 factor (sigma-E family)